VSKRSFERLRFNSLQAAILAELREAGEEDLCTLLNALTSTAGGEVSLEFLWKYLSELQRLHQAGFLQFRECEFLPGRRIRHEPVSFDPSAAAAKLSIDGESNQWKWSGQLELNVELAPDYVGVLAD
jgi:hypothetical protein